MSGLALSGIVLAMRSRPRKKVQVSAVPREWKWPWSTYRSQRHPVLPSAGQPPWERVCSPDELSAPDTQCQFKFFKFSSHQAQHSRMENRQTLQNWVTGISVFHTLWARIAMMTLPLYHYSLCTTEIPVLQSKVCLKDLFHKIEWLPFLMPIILPHLPRITLAFI